MTFVRHILPKPNSYAASCKFAFFWAYAGGAKGSFYRELSRAYSGGAKAAFNKDVWILGTLGVEPGMAWDSSFPIYIATQNWPE